MSSMALRFPPPENEQDFELLCSNLFAEHWAAPNTKLHGRRGQRQDGVDFFGQPDDGTVRGGQAKLHVLPAILTIDEVEVEVRKAMNFKPALTHFVVATTSRRDASLQRFAAEKTKEHRQKGLFSVEIFSWDDICDLLQMYSTVQEHFYGGIGSHLAKKLSTDITAVRFTVEEIASRSIGGLAHAEIDRAVAHIKAGQTREAKLLLNDLRQRQWDALSPRERFRLLANLGHIHERDGDVKGAAKLYLEAKSFQPEDVKAKALEVYAHFNLGDEEMAKRLAAELWRTSPASPEAAAAYIRAFGSSIGVDEILRMIPPHLRDDTEVAFALADLMARAHRLVEAEAFARHVVQNEPDSVLANERLASILLDQETTRGHHRAGARPLTGNPQKVTEVIALLSKAIAKVKNMGNAEAEARIRLKRSLAYEMMED